MTSSSARPRCLAARLASLALLIAVPAAAQQRPMTFLDLQQLRSAGNAAVSPDGRRVLYTLSVPDWKEARRTTDIYLVSVDGGVASTRRMTFTRDKNETGPEWSRDGAFFVFSSNREGTGTSATTQLYLMRPDGGEAMRLTDAKDGVANFAFSRDGTWLVYAAGKADERQLWALPVAGIDSARPKQLTRHATPIRWWTIAPDSRRIYFTAPDTLDQDNRTRVEKKFTVNIRNEPQPPEQLWALEIEPGKEVRLTSDTSYSVSGVTLSRDGRWLGFRGAFNNRYQRNVTESGMYADVYLLETATGTIERLTNNAEIGESPVSFSPDGSMMAISAENDWTYFRDEKLYVRPTGQRGGAWRKLGGNFDGAMSTGWWSADGKTIYFTTGVRTTTQVMAASVETGEVRQVTSVQGTVSASQDEDTGLILVGYADNHSASDLFAVRSPDQLADRSAWARLTSSNPQVAGFALGDAEEITWKSKDGKMVGGILVKPVGWQAGRRYPLIVQIHGGPAGADVLRFSPGYGAQVYAGNGYAVLLPNYRGSINYGERHRLDIVGVGNYFQKGYEDIMTGVDFLIGQGIAHPDSMGVMGWSAGGHWSNWILTHTNRFKAISSGAGAMNWISMYAQSDVQRNRAEYFANGQKPWENFDAYWQVSPLRFIRNARTPTLIHVVEGDPRVPRPQSEELHMALKQQGVPTEFFVYPGNTHGIPDPRN
ncbi:MAG: WD40-like beta Propeller containing protein, partial [Gemmatimonadetes bacterium]|nr:WD40-like beta Propeller containing protein [Gemmatimonadota bacterium]